MLFSPQIAPSDVENLRDQGVKSILCCRPDDEQPGQPSFKAIEQAAQEAGLKAYFVPVVPGVYGPDDVSALREVLAQAEAPVLAYCGSGKRAQDFCACVNQA